MPDRPFLSAPVRFGPFEVDPKSGELRKRGVRIKLQEQPLQILQMLLAHPGQVVAREELRQHLWPADTFVDFDHGLYNAIKRLREALGDVADTPRFIETIPKRGYRFIASVTGSDQIGSSATVHADASANTSPAAISQALTLARRRWLTPLAGMAILLLFFGLILGLNAEGIGSRVWAVWRKPPQIHSLAVLPLKNLSDDPTQEYFSYGMTEELITDLAQISALRVISHTSVLQYAKSTKPLPQIARELGVDGIVEGAVQRSGDRVRITAQLIYAPEEQHLWAASYDRDFRDVLTLQSSVAAEIVGPIRARTASPLLTPRKGLTAPPLEALEDYLRGEYAMEQTGGGAGIEGYNAAIAYFKKAINEDPNFAPAYVKLADTYDSGFVLWPNEKASLERALVSKALELDPGSAEAHLINANLKNWHDCDLRGAEEELRKAVRLNPNLVDAHDQLSDDLVSLGRLDEAATEADRAKALDPGGLHGLALALASGHYDRAIAQIQEHLELHPDDGYAYINPTGLIDVFHFAGRDRESAEAMQKAWTLFGFKEIGQGVGKAYAESGYAGALRYSAKQMERLYAERRVNETEWIAHWYARAGDRENAIKWLRIAYGENNHCVDLSPDGDYSLLRSDPRFAALVTGGSQQ